MGWLLLAAKVVTACSNREYAGSARTAPAGPKARLFLFPVAGRFPDHLGRGGCLLPVLDQEVRLFRFPVAGRFPDHLGRGGCLLVCLFRFLVGGLFPDHRGCAGVRFGWCPIAATRAWQSSRALAAVTSSSERPLLGMPWSVVV